jgi:hypothetical protein
VKSGWQEGHTPETLAFEDEILIHEMVHAIRQTAGLSNRRAVPRQPRYDTMEELVAIVVANIYRSERHRIGVRNSDHRTAEIMAVSGKHFLHLEFNRAHLRRFCWQHPAFVRDLSAIDAYFNPFQHMKM